MHPCPESPAAPLRLLLGDNLTHLRAMPDNSVDAIVTDPPYGLSFMGKEWDYDVPQEEMWAEALRVLKPGGHLLSFFGSRTYHRGVVRIEDAGFEIRDQIMWVFGGGFPKSHNLTGEHKGFGTALKPAHEPLVLARKPLIGTVTQNVQAHGTGAINIDGCRISAENETIQRGSLDATYTNADEGYQRKNRSMMTHKPLERSGPAHEEGRWPANFIHDGSDEVLALFPETTSGSAARFFYCAKASKKDRGPDNSHPTVKPTDLMRYLCRLVTPPGGTVLDPFMGSGSTGKAARLEGFAFIGMERDPDYFAIAQRRLSP